jgi:hypothetical protein
MSQAQKRTPAGAVYDVELGEGHWLRWTEVEGELSGGVIIHTLPEKQPGDIRLETECWGHFVLRYSNWAAEHPQKDTWLLTGHRETPTLSPSFLCHCGDHGYVREGRWEKA